MARRGADDDRYKSFLIDIESNTETKYSATNSMIHEYAGINVRAQLGVEEVGDGLQITVLMKK